MASQLKWLAPGDVIVIAVDLIIKRVEVDDRTAGDGLVVNI